MSIAEADGTRIAYIAEVTPGTTPATPAFQVLRAVSESLAIGKQTVTSAEIRADKNIADLIKTGYSVAGGINCEFSDATFEDMIESVMRSTWSTNTMVNGITGKSFTFEKTFEAGATDAYMRYRGCYVDQMTISAQSRSLVELSMNIMGLGGDPAAAAIIAGATYTAATSTDVMPSGTHVGTLTMVGSTSPILKGFDITISSQNREQQQISSDDLAGIALGQCMVEGTLNLYLDSIDEYNLMFNHTVGQLVIPLGADTGEKYTLTIPKTHFMAGDPVAGGNGQDVAFDMAFKAKFDSGIAGTIQIDRNVA